MYQIVTEINTAINALKIDLNKNLARNKAAGARARKATLQLEKLFKEYRKASIQAQKTPKTTQK